MRTANGFSDPNHQDATFLHTWQTDFLSAISCYGGCAREILGSAGCLGDRFANLRTAATPSCLATCRGGPFFHLEETS
ncbi:hypothetical protein CEC48_23700 [Pseudomonas sp. K2I15]|nr:hypothetical protein CEC48_23700 [Pseudomonas sp. K2I15]